MRTQMFPSSVLVTTTSGFPSPLKSSTVTPPGSCSMGRRRVTPNVTESDGFLTGRFSLLEVPPPGAGLAIAMDAVPGEAMSAAEIEAVSWDAAMNDVGRGLPFQSNTEPGTKPVPFTVKVKAAPPGATLAGTAGSFKEGTGLICARAVLVARNANVASKFRNNAFTITLSSPGDLAPQATGSAP